MKFLVYNILILWGTVLPAFADSNLFDTEWGTRFNHSPVGNLFFAICGCVGVLAVLRSLFLVFNMNRYPHSYVRGYSTAFAMMLGGGMLYDMHATMNVLYNTFFN